MPRPQDVVFPRRREREEDRRKEGQHRKLLDEFFDHSTLLAVSRLMHRGLFESVDYPVSTGKEGGVFRATSADGFRALKIYRVNNSVFRHLPEYALDSLRRESSAKNFGGLIFAWTRREHTILGRLADAGVRAPRPFGHFRNALVMEFIGDTEGSAAPRVVDVPIEDPAALYEDLVAQVGRMAREAHLVHGDLSPYNVLFQDGHTVLIDVAQAVASDHPNALALMERDVRNFSKFLARWGYSVEPADFLDAVGGKTLGPPPAEA